MVSHLHVPLIEPEDVVRHLGKQEMHWKEGRSAHALTHSWCNQNGFPQSIRALFATHPSFRSAELVDGFFERKVDLGSEGRHSQTDLLAVAALDNSLAIVAVEGKAGEPFGDLVEQWHDGSGGKTERLERLCATLGLRPDNARSLRYQLLHRTASAIYEAKRYRTDVAVLLVQSFSEDKIGFADFSAFLRALGVKELAPGVLIGPVFCEGVSLYAAWVQETPRLGDSPSAYLDDLRSYAQRLSQWCQRVGAWCDERSSKLKSGAAE